MEMAFKLFVFQSILAVIVFAQEEDWSCETVKGAPCSAKPIMIKGGDQKYPYINGSRALNCSDTRKEESNTVFHSTTLLDNLDITTIDSCQVLSTPCITDFEVCIKDPNVPTITLKCRYLKDFDQAENGNATPDSQHIKCGGTAAKRNTYLLDSGNGTTTIIVNGEEIRIWKPVNGPVFKSTFITNACSPLPKQSFLFLFLFLFSFL